MDIQLFSAKNTVRQLQDCDTAAILQLCQGNPIYYQYCPPIVSAASIHADMSALPPGKTAADKYYIGFFAKDELIAVMDLIDCYPDPQTMFIGFFMMERRLQHQGIGSAIIAECCRYWQQLGREKVRLGYVKGNRQSESFWHRNAFQPVGESTSAAHGCQIIMMERMLNRASN